MSEFTIKDFNGKKVEFSSNKDWTKEFRKKSYDDLIKEENNMKNEVLYIDTKKLSKKEIKELNKIVSDNEIMSKHFCCFEYDERTEILKLIKIEPKLISVKELKQILNK